MNEIPKNKLTVKDYQEELKAEKNETARLRKVEQAMYNEIHLLRQDLRIAQGKLEAIATVARINKN